MLRFTISKSAAIFTEAAPSVPMPSATHLSFDTRFDDSFIASLPNATSRFFLMDLEKAVTRDVRLPNWRAASVTSAVTFICILFELGMSTAPYFFKLLLLIFFLINDANSIPNTAKLVNRM